jgi:serine protease Do
MVDKTDESAGKKRSQNLKSEALKNEARKEEPAASPFAIPELHERAEPRKKLLAVAFLVMVSLAAGFVGGWAGTTSHNSTQDASRTSQQKIISGESNLISSIAKDVSPSVVSIDVTGQTTAGASSSYFGNAAPHTSKSAGTGIIIASNGLIVTNRHVVPAGTTDVNVTLSDGTELDDVEVIGRTRDSDSLDIAFLRIKDAKGKKLVAAKMGDSSKVLVGDKVVAIGNALGQFQNTVTSGIISGYGRSVEAEAGDGSGDSENLQDLFQTDAAINAGNSGGPLVNINGEVIGINSAIAGDGAQGIGFAIPTADISGLIKTVISTGKFQQPYLGVRYVPLTNDVAEQLKLNVTRGAYVLTSDQAGGQDTVLDGSPADKAGIKPGDVILEINGKKIDERNGLTVILNQKGVNDKVTLKVLRDGKERNIVVTLEPAPSDSM